MFENFPKTRVELPEEFKRIYSEHYKNNREGNTSASSVSQKMETWLHKKVAEDVSENQDKYTLEIGAGTLNQLKYEQVKLYDIIEPFSELYTGSEYIGRINEIYSDIDQIPGDRKYDRITAIATFEHITNLPDVIARTCLLLKKGGVLRISIPNEGSILWKLGWMLTTGVEFRLKYGLDYSLLMKHEHVNTAKEIIDAIKYFYQDVNCSYFGINRTFAFYVYIECTNPKIKTARDYLINDAKQQV